MAPRIPYLASDANASRRPRILAFNRFYLPGFRSGGPVRTLANMADQLGEEFDFRIVTLDRDKGDPTTYPGVSTDTWTPVGRAAVLYLPAHAVTPRKIGSIARHLRPHAIYLNSCFDPVFTQRVLVARRLGWLSSTPVLLAPRGEFSRGALALKALKKRTYLGLSRAIRFYEQVVWQASSELERDDISNAIPGIARALIRVAEDVPPGGEWNFKPVERASGRLRVCILSRISRMKNIDYALRVLASVQNPVHCTILGPKEDEVYWKECEGLARGLPNHVEVEYGGEVHPELVPATLASYDLFFLPTHGENYGHVIREALAAGVPVLISDQTPWRELEAHGVGWALPLDNPSKFVAVIENVAGWTVEMRRDTAERCNRFASDPTRANRVLEANRRLLLDVVSGKLAGLHAAP